MKATYGYDDASGAYFLTIDTDKCDGCGKCVVACPENVLEIAEDDYGKSVAMVKEKMATRLGYVCPGFERGCNLKSPNCRSVCLPQAIDHSW